MTRPHTIAEMLALSILIPRIRRDVDPTLADLVDRYTRGDDTALVGIQDRLTDLDRQGQAERLAGIRAVLGL